ncbi:MAG: DNA polymerase III subunit gamma/tau [Anaerolineales bacterium]|nr:DNA polymerase III subunit gamma/tau [Anaerolineales bacterium]
MANQALYLKWRPNSFDDMIGQEHVTRTLLGAIRQGRIRHAYLFSGPRGTGKTTSARLLAKAVNCLHPEPERRPCNNCVNCAGINSGRFLDIIEIDAASHTSVDDVRELRDKIAFAPSEGAYKVYIIDEVHRFSGAAFDALLKTLEEPPAHAIFVLATTEMNKVPDTIKSRCLVFEFRRVSLREVTDHLRRICEQEGLNIDTEALELIARQGTGSVRDSISLLDQIVADPTQHVTYELAQLMLGAAGAEYVWKVAQAIADQDTAYGLEMINQAIDTGADPRQFGRQVVDHLRQLLLVRMGSGNLVDVSDDTRAWLTDQTQYFSHAVLLKAIRAFNSAVEDTRGGWQPQLPLELALVDCTLAIAEEPPPTPSSKQQPRSAPPSPPVPPRQPPLLSQQQQVSFNDFYASWPQIVESAKREGSASLEGVLNHCQPLRVDGNMVVIGVDNDTHRSQIEKQRNITALVNAIQGLFGAGIEVRLELVHATNQYAGDAFYTLAQKLGGEIIFKGSE